MVGAPDAVRLHKSHSGTANSIDELDIISLHCWKVAKHRSGDSRRSAFVQRLGLAGRSILVENAHGEAASLSTDGFSRSTNLGGQANDTLLLRRR